MHNLHPKNNDIQNEFFAYIHYSRISSLIIFRSLLELEDPDYNEGDEEGDWSRDIDKYVSVVKQTFLMMLRDLTSLQTFKYCE